MTNEENIMELCETETQCVVYPSTLFGLVNQMMNGLGMMAKVSSITEINEGDRAVAFSVVPLGGVGH